MRQLAMSETRAVSGAGLFDRMPQPMHGPEDYLQPFTTSTAAVPAIGIPLPRIPGPGPGDDGGDPTHPGGGQGGSGGGSGGSHRITCDDTGCQWV